MTTPPLASFGVTPTYGAWYDEIIGKGIRWATATNSDYAKPSTFRGRFEDARVNHAVVYVGEVQGYDKPQLVQARPGGASFADWDSYGTSMIWSNNDLAGVPAITPAQQAVIVSFAVDCAIKKIGYNYLDFVAIALAQQRFHELVHYRPEENGWIVRQAVARLSNDKRLICSQLVDYCYKKAGVHLFTDGRPEGLVSPADLYNLILL